MLPSAPVEPSPSPMLVRNNSSIPAHLVWEKSGQTECPGSGAYLSPLAITMNDGGFFVGRCRNRHNGREMVILLTALHILVSFFLIIVVLLQSGKAADLAGAFGGMGSQTAFGPRGAATVLSKATTTAAVLFMLTSITLGILQGRRVVGESVIDRTGVGSETTETSAPAEGEGQTAVPPATSQPPLEADEESQQ